MIITGIKKIRSSEARVRRRWVITLSAVTMIAVVIVWLSYLASVVKPAVSRMRQVQNDSLPNSGQEFWPIMQNGLRIVTSQIKSKLQDIISGKPLAIKNNP